MWDSTDDCCERRCTFEHPCNQGEGDCDTDNDCLRPTWQSCVQDTCSNSVYFPIDKFPNNTNARFVEIFYNNHLL